MPASLCSGDCKDNVPPGLACIDIKRLTSRTNLQDKYVQAHIHHRYSYNKEPVPSLKIILEDAEGHLIDLLAIGQVAEDLNVCEKGDTLVCLKFEVEACPAHYSHRAYQIIVDDTGSVGSLVQIYKKNGTPTTAQSASAPQQVLAGTSTAPQQNVSEKTKGKVSSYSYKALSGLKVNTVVDVYGVVTFFKPPVKTRGSDYYCAVTLADPSLDDPEDKLPCNIFNRDLDKLPKLEVGDVIRFHRLKVQTYQGKKQGYNGPGFQWLVYRGSVENREASSANYTFTENDRDKAQSLINWWSKEGDVSQRSSTKTLAQVQAKDFFDLVCQVVCSCEIEKDRCLLLRVWDGTTFEGPLKRITEDEFNDTILEDETLSTASKDLAVDLFLFDNWCPIARDIKPGDYVQLTNLHAAVVSDQVELTLHGGTWYNRRMDILAPDSTQVNRLRAVLDPLVQKVKEQNCAIGCGAETDKQSHWRTGKASFTYSRRKRKIREPDSEDEELDDGLNEDKRALQTANSDEGCQFFKEQIAQTSSDRSDKRAKLSPEHGEMSSGNVNNSCATRGDVFKGINVPRTKSAICTYEKSKETLAIQDKDKTSTDIHTKPNLSGNSFSSVEENSEVGCSRCHNDGNAVNASDISSNSSQSVWISAYDDSDYDMQIHAQIREEDRNVAIADGADLQDENISSSNGSSKASSDQERNNGKPCSMSEQSHISVTSSDRSNPNSTHDTSKANSVQNHSDGLGRQPLDACPIPSQESYQIAASPEREDISDIKDHESPAGSVTQEPSKSSPQRGFLSLRSKGSMKRKPDAQCMREIFSTSVITFLDASILCFDTITFTENSQKKTYADTGSLVGETDRDTAGEFMSPQDNPDCVMHKDSHAPHTQSSGSQVLKEKLLVVDSGESVVTSSTISDSHPEDGEEMPRCMLKTASTIVNHPHISNTPLREVLDHEIPYKFRILVRVQDFQPRPSKAEDLVNFYCPECRYCTSATSMKGSHTALQTPACPNCTINPVNLKPSIILNFLLTDGDSCLSVYLWNEYAIQFFNGIEPLQLLSNEESFQQVQRWLDNLCPVDSNLDDRPWLECCVFSYSIGEDVKFQIFDTVLV